MMPRASEDNAIVEWGCAGAALPGQTDSGDLHVVALFPNGVLVALIDGLGHGPQAALAARVAARMLTELAGESPRTAVERCHEGLRQTRGVAMTVVSFDAEASSLTWLGVGNVEGALFRGGIPRTCESVPQRGGVVGYQLPPLREQVLSIAHGDTVVLATDGIRADFRDGIDALVGDVQAIADAILARHARGSDDACVLVARYIAHPWRVVRIVDESDVAIARKCVRELAGRAGFPEPTIEGLATAVSELARNIVLYATTGEIRVELFEEKGRAGLRITASDEGPGIPDPQKAMEDGYSTGAGLGFGLSGARRFADDFEISSTIGTGTTVTLKKWVR